MLAHHPSGARPERSCSGPGPRSGARGRGVGLAALGAVLLLAGCGGGGVGGGGDADQSAEGSSGSSSGGLALAQSPEPSETCEEAPAIAQGRFAGTLRDRKPDPVIGGVCGGGGPDVFLRIEVPLRADLRVEARGNGFTPRVSLAPLGCLAAPMLACGADGIAELADLGEGTMVSMAIGVDEPTFLELSEVAAPSEGEDPLGFVVRVAMKRVLPTGEVCRPVERGRCASGTLCMPEVLAVEGEEDGAEGASDTEEAEPRWLCTTVPGDRCDDPERVTVKLSAGEGTLMVDPDAPQTDAHRHGCTGAGTRERVMRLRLPDGLGPFDSLQIRSDRPEVGLALRAPGCLASDELDCAGPSAAGSRVVIEAPDELERAGVEPYLFIELPEPGVLTEPVSLQLRRVVRGPPIGT